MPRLSRLSGLVALAAALALGAAACSKVQKVAPGVGVPNVVQVRSFPALEKASRNVAAVAVAPFEARERGEMRASEGPARTAAPLVARQVAEALSARGVNVIPPEDMARALANAGVDAARATPEQLAAVAKDGFGADLLLTGRVMRFRELRGENLGASAPASVAFEVTLHDAPAGARLWQATFDETQQPLSANVFNAGRYPGGGTRWLKADELSKWGADGVANAFPVQTRTAAQ